MRQPGTWLGACIHYFGEDRAIQLRLWERSGGHLGIPDMTLIIIRISFRGAQEVIRFLALSDRALKG